MDDIRRIKAQHKINKASSKLELPQAFIDKFPNIKIEKAQKLFRRYADSLARAIVSQIAYMKDNQIQMSLEAMTNMCADFKYEKERYWVWKEFNTFYPLINVIDKGNNLKGRNSVVEINDNNLRKLLFEASSEALYEGLFGEAQSAGVQPEWVIVDQDNLANYIGNCDIQLAHNAEGKGASWADKIRRNQVQALVVARIAADNGGRFPQYPKPSVFGRTYYYGLSIQSMSKEVRSAALGEHYQYDMSAAIFGTKLAVITAAVARPKERYPEQRLEGRYTYTKQYLQEKDKLRASLARDCLTDMNVPDASKVKIIKNAITAIGFGAKTDGIMWSTTQLPALHEIIKNKADRERFMAHPFVKSFIAEQEELTVDIIDHLKQVGSFDAIKQAIKDVGTVGRITDAHILAYLFQHYETDMMDEVAAIAARQTPVVARIHDAFVTMEQLSPKTMSEIEDALGGIHSLLKLEEDHRRKWRPVEQVKAQMAQDQFEQEHKRRIEEEDRIAKEEIRSGKWDGMRI